MAQAIAGAVVAIDIIAVVCAIGMVMCAAGYVLSVHQGTFIPHPQASDSDNMAAWIGAFASWMMSLFALAGATLTIGITTVINWVTSPLMSLFNTVRYSWLPWVLHEAQTFALGVGSTIAVVLSASIGMLQLALTAMVRAAVTALWAGITGVATWAQSEVTLLWRGIGIVEQNTQAALQGIEAGVRDDLNALAHGMEISLQNVEQGIEHEIAAEVSGIEAQIGATARGLQGDITGVEDWVRGLIGGAVLPAIGALGLGLRALEQEFTKTNEQCTQPLCRNLGGLSNVLGLLGELGVDALMVALLAELLHDPQAVSRDVQNIAVPIVRGAGGAVLQQAA